MDNEKAFQRKISRKSTTCIIARITNNKIRIQLKFQIQIQSFDSINSFVYTYVEICVFFYSILLIYSINSIRNYCCSGWIESTPESGPSDKRCIYCAKNNKSIVRLDITRTLRLRGIGQRQRRLLKRTP